MIMFVINISSSFYLSIYLYIYLSIYPYVYIYIYTIAVKMQWTRRGPDHPPGQGARCKLEGADYYYYY